MFFLSLYTKYAEEHLMLGYIRGFYMRQEPWWSLRGSLSLHLHLQILFEWRKKKHLLIGNEFLSTRIFCFQLFWFLFIMQVSAIKKTAWEHSGRRWILLLWIWWFSSTNETRRPVFSGTVWATFVGGFNCDVNVNPLSIQSLSLSRI